MVLSAARMLRAEQPAVELILLGATGDVEALSEAFTAEGVGICDGTVSSAGRISLQAIQRGVDLALSGEASGLVTGPIHKPALQAAGAGSPGHTELLRELTGAHRVGMLMAAESTRLGPPLRILLATTHLALRDVPSALTEDLLEDQILLLRDSLRDLWGIPRPRIALCALNPHASDGGLFGDEEARVMTPAVERLRDRGVEVTLPLSADTVFLQAIEKSVDAVVVPYHDVGMAVFKTLAFGRGVNVTLGLPFIRTSPDHGTAFDLVGTGLADPTSTLEALRLAARLALHRKSSPL